MIGLSDVNILHVYYCESHFSDMHEHRQLFVLKQSLDWKLSFEIQKLTKPSLSHLRCSIIPSALLVRLFDLMWTMEQSTMCNVIGVACSDRDLLPESAVPHFSVFELIVLVLQFTTSYSVSQLWSDWFKTAAADWINECIKCVYTDPLNYEQVF